MIFLLAITITAINNIPNSYALSHTDYNEQLSSLHQNNMWYLGKNLAPGDSYTYKICDPMAIINYSAESYHYFVQGKDHNDSLCYMIKLDFVSLLSSDENNIDSNIWVVQAIIQDFADDNKDTIRRSVFHIDSESFAVKSADTIHPDTLRYANSLEDTIFSIYKYADEPKLLKIGAKWGQITEALYETGTNPHMTVLNDTREFSVTQTEFNNQEEIFVPTQRTFSDVFEVGYEIDIRDEKNVSKDIKDVNNVISTYLVSSEIPFPLSAAVYSPVHVIKPFKQYEYELLSLFTDGKMITISSDNDILFDATNNEIAENDNIDENTNVADNDTSENIPDTVDDTTDTTISDKIDNNNDDYIDDIIIDESGTTNNQKNIIKENIISDNKDLDNNSIISDSGNQNTENNDEDNSNSSAIVAVFVLLIMIVGIVFYFKKFRNKDHLHDDNIISKTIHFKDRITIRIKNNNDDNFERKSA